MKRTISIVILAMAAGLVSGWHWRGGPEHQGLQAQPAAQQPPGDEFSPEEQVNIQVYERVNRSVVHITTMSARLDSFLLVESPTEGAGSGSVIDREGHILTNYHVIAGAREIRVRLFDGQEYAAGLVGKDPLNDIAVIKINAPATSLIPIQLGDSSNLRVGQKIHAIGNPFGLERTYTVGIISSLNRTLPASNYRTLKSIIQVDAALNQGNSGGPLLNSQAKLVGMNMAIASRVGENSGVGFAIPVNTIKRVVPQLIQSGKVVRADIGITRVYQTDSGLLIATLARGGPAEKAGLRGFRLVRTQQRRGPFVYEETRVDQNHADLIVGVNGKKIDTVDDFLTEVEMRQPGEKVRLRVIREGKPIEIEVTLDQAR
jgi:S1-C subfamily serine protease